MCRRKVSGRQLKVQKAEWVPRAYDGSQSGGSEGGARPSLYPHQIESSATKPTAWGPFLCILGGNHCPQSKGSRRGGRTFLLQVHSPGFVPRSYKSQAFLTHICSGSKSQLYH